MGADQYDAYAENYDRENSSSLLNAHYAKPAMLRLAGEVSGRRVLDAGCGSGPLSLALQERGAHVTGIDGSQAMIDIARRRLGDEAPLHVGDLAEPLPFTDDSFDDVVASLVLHYLEDWDAPLAEFARVLRPRGRLLVSVNHPTVRFFNEPSEDYFATYRYTETFEFSGEQVEVAFWHRPLRAMSEAFARAGFTMRLVDEPAPDPATPVELLPPRIASGERSTFLCFLFFSLEVA